jgi:predicted 3-demethylubiquinone-9 3-methyltransferase (glyoxalase superfamily)
MENQKITPCLWVEEDAKEVAAYYLSIFKDGKLKDYRLFENTPSADGSGNDGSFSTAVMELAGVEFSILAAGPYFKFNEAFSLVINCKDQAEVDYYWERSLQTEERKGIADGAKTSMVYHGKLFLSNTLN